MNARKLFIFKHDSKLGNAPAHKLFEAISVDRKSSEGPARSFKEDYIVTCNKSEIPDGVEVIEKL